MKGNIVKPITPDEVIAVKEKNTPGAVIESFTERIAQVFSNGFAQFWLSDVVKLMVKKGLKEDDIYVNHWLKVEDIYLAVGWNVSYTHSADCNAYWCFSFSKEEKDVHGAT